MSEKKLPKWIGGAECWLCTRCEKHKPREEMGIRRASPNGLNCYCLECLVIRRKEQWRKNIDHNRTQSRASSARDLAKNPNRTKDYYKANRDTLLVKDRAKYAESAPKRRAQMSEYGKSHRAEREDYRRQYNIDNRQKYLARKRINSAVYRGTIVKPAKCEDCNTPTPKHKLSGHHADYSKPYDVNWVCRKCHNIRDEAMELDSRTTQCRLL